MLKGNIAPQHTSHHLLSTVFPVAQPLLINSYPSCKMAFRTLILGVINIHNRWQHCQTGSPGAQTGLQQHTAAPHNPGLLSTQFRSRELWPALLEPVRWDLQSLSLTPQTPRTQNPVTEHTLYMNTGSVVEKSVLSCPTAQVFLPPTNKITKIAPHSAAGYSYGCCPPVLCSPSIKSVSQGLNWIMYLCSCISHNGLFWGLICAGSLFGNCFMPPA